MGLYVYRADEDRERLPYAPYVLREEEHIVELPLDTTKCGTLPATDNTEAADTTPATGAKQQPPKPPQNKGGMLIENIGTRERHAEMSMEIRKPRNKIGSARPNKTARQLLPTTVIPGLTTS